MSTCDQAVLLIFRNTQLLAVVTVGKLFTLIGSQIPHLFNGDDVILTSNIVWTME